MEENIKCTYKGLGGSLAKRVPSLLTRPPSSSTSESLSAPWSSTFVGCWFEELGWWAEGPLGWWSLPLGLAAAPSSLSWAAKASRSVGLNSCELLWGCCCFSRCSSLGGRGRGREGGRGSGTTDSKCKFNKPIYMQHGAARQAHSWF